MKKMFLYQTLVMLMFVSLSQATQDHVVKHEIKKHKRIAQGINSGGTLISLILAMIAENPAKLRLSSHRSTLQASSNAILLSSWLGAMAYDFSKTHDGPFSIAFNHTLRTFLTRLCGGLLFGFVECQLV